MRTLPAPLRAALDSGVTTHCRCWRVERTDGSALGFTDHDRPLTFEGTVFEPESGLTAEALEAALGLATDSHAVEGALRSDAISDADLERGLFDGARVTQWLVDWKTVESRLVLSAGRIGEVRRRGTHFEAEVLGLAEALNQPLGRAYLRQCDLRLGEPGCGIDLSLPAYRGEGVVSAAIGARLEVTGLEGFADGWFARGTLRWTTGANHGADASVRAHRAGAGGGAVDLWEAPAASVAPGDVFVVTAGCDKTAETCRAKFENFLNFRGFPHIPGDDWAASYAEQGGRHDGGSLFRV